MDSNIVLTTAGSAIGMVYFIEQLKKAKWFPWLNEYTNDLNRLVGVLAAGAVSFGIHYEWDAATRVLAITVPTATQFAHLTWNWFVQWALQQYAFKTGVTPTPVKEEWL